MMMMGMGGGDGMEGGDGMDGGGGGEGCVRAVGKGARGV